MFFRQNEQISDELIRKFAQLLGDYNPIHLDEEFARSTRSAAALHTEC